MSDGNLSLSVSDFGVRLSFLRAVPGSEQRLYEELSGADDTEAILKCLGEFDMLCVSKLPAAGLVSEIFEPKSLIVDTHVVPAFMWEAPEIDPVSRLADVLKRPFLSVTLLKFRSSLVRRYGVELEQRLFAHMTNLKAGPDFQNRWLDIAPGYGINRPAPQAISLGSLGWYESILLVGADHIEDLFATVSIARTTQLSDLMEEVSTDETVFDDSYTVPCLDWKILAEHVYSELGDVENAGVFVGIHPANKQKTLMWMNAVFPDAKLSEVFGEYDYYLEPRSGTTLGALVEGVVEGLRAVPGSPDAPQTKSTRTVLRKSALDLDVGITMPKPEESQKWLIELPSELCEPLRQHDEDRHNPLYSLPTYAGLRHAFSAYNASVNANQIYGPLHDFWPFFQSLKATLTDSIRGREAADPNSANDLLAKLDAAIQLFQFAHAQRTRGAFGVPLGGSDPISGRFGGLQRALAAASAVPMALNRNQFGLMWDGFIVFGYRSEPLKAEFGALNLPAESALAPWEWFLIFHEIGHDHAALRRLLADPEVHKRVIERFPRVESRWPRGEYLVLETYSDIFDFVFGFRGVWDLYIKNVWTFLREYRGSRPREHQRDYLLRSLFVFAYKQLAIAKNPSRREISIMLQHLIETVKQWFPLEEPNRTRIIEDFFALAPLLEIFPRFLPAPNAIPVPGEDWFASVAEVTNDLREGRVVSDIDDPRMVLLALADSHEREPLSFGASTAVILSLWNTYLRLSDERDGQFATQFEQLSFDFDEARL